jgi:hypothetical protein
MVGSFTNGFLIPTRPAYEAMTSQGASERDYRDRRLQKDVIPEEFLPDDPEIPHGNTRLYGRAGKRDSQRYAIRESDL